MSAAIIAVNNLSEGPMKAPMDFDGSKAVAALWAAARAAAGRFEKPG